MDAFGGGGATAPRAGRIKPAFMRACQHLSHPVNANVSVSRSGQCARHRAYFPSTGRCGGLRSPARNETALIIFQVRRRGRARCLGGLDALGARQVRETGPILTRTMLSWVGVYPPARAGGTRNYDASAPQRPVTCEPAHTALPRRKGSGILAARGEAMSDRPDSSA